MDHRRLNTENTFNYINPNILELSNYKVEIEKIISLKTGEDKLLFMTIFIENNIEIQDIFSNFFYSNNQSTKVNDLVKYYLIYMLSLLDSKIMKLCFPNLPIKNNNIVVTKDSPLDMSKKLFQVLFSLLAFSEKDVQYTVLDLLLHYSDMSNYFIDYCLEDSRYIDKIFNLTYNNNNLIINSSIIILDNILIDENCDPDKLEKLILLKICAKLTIDDDIIIQLKNVGLADVFFSYLSTKDLESIFLIFLL